MKKIVLCLSALAFVLIALPGLAAAFAGARWGMAACLVLFFAVNPLCAILTGVFAGRDVKARRGLPLVFAGLVLAGVWAFFDRGEPAFLLYALGYLGLGLLSMLAAAWVRSRARRQRPAGDGGQSDDTGEVP